MSFWKNVTEKSWEHAGEVDELQGGEVLRQPTRRSALRIFLCVVTSVFFLLFVAYRIRMDYPDWRPLPLPNVLWFNTVLLVLASAVMQWTRAQVGKTSASALRAGMVAAGLLTLGFVAGQWVAWSQLSHQGFGLRSNPANAFFYLLTAVHVAHVLGGLWVWLLATVRAFRKEVTASVAGSIQLCATYWHFLLLVWLVMLYFLLTT